MPLKKLERTVKSEINDGDNHLVLAHAGDGVIAIEDINNDGEASLLILRKWK